MVACCPQWSKQSSSTFLWSTAVLLSIIDIVLWADCLNEWSKNHSHLIKMLAAFAPAIIAGIAVMIANRQHRTAVNKLKLDLFEKRYAYYERVHKFIFSAANLKFSRSDYWVCYKELIEVIDLVKFIAYDSELVKWLEEIKDRAAQHYVDVQAIQSLPEGSMERLQKEADTNQTIIKFWDDIKQLPEKFRPLLTIEAS
jgi:hypothetical protein